ncbi:MAG: hypothetical protein GX967_00820 [Clostridiales bacterium]|nr:hypothetical protein [Clostridiales bacterium]
MNSNDAYAILSNMDEKTKQYFDSLPGYVKETIMQTGVEIKSQDELRQLAENIENNK